MPSSLTAPSPANRAEQLIRFTSPETLPRSMSPRSVSSPPGARPQHSRPRCLPARTRSGGKPSSAPTSPEPPLQQDVRLVPGKAHNTNGPKRQRCAQQAAPSPPHTEGLLPPGQPSCPPVPGPGSREHGAAHAVTPLFPYNTQEVQRARKEEVILYLNNKTPTTCYLLLNYEPSLLSQRHITLDSPGTSPAAPGARARAGARGRSWEGTGAAPCPPHSTIPCPLPCPPARRQTSQPSSPQGLCRRTDRPHATAAHVCSFSVPFLLI